MAEEETPETTDEETPQEVAKPEDADKPDKPDAEAEGDDDGEEEEGGKKDADYFRRQLRRVERQAKQGSAKDKKEIADLRAKLDKIEKANQSEQEKAIEAAKEEGRSSAAAEAQKERRADRLALAVERMAGKGIKTGEGDDAAEVKFRAKPTLVLLERAIDSGDLDTSTLFDDKDKVRTEGLAEAVSTLLEDEEWLAVKPEAPAAKTTAESDAGKGGKSGSKSLDEMTPDDHLAQIQGRK